MVKDSNRLWEVDSARGIAIIMMVISNFLFDLYLFAGCHECYSGFWFYFARATAVLFIILMGMSLTLSYSRGGDFPKYLKRGLRIFGWGMLITAATFPFVPEGIVLFGILHLIGISIILAYPFLKKKGISLFLGIGVILLGFLVETITVSYPWLLWLGFQPVGYFSVDYTPLFPWFGVALMGVFLGNLIFPGGRSTRKNNSLAIRILASLGKRSLLIYLIHQPIFIAALSLYLGGLAP